MARLAGRKGRVYLGIASSSAEAEPVPFLATWSLNATTDKLDATAMGDVNKTYIADMPDASGDFAGFLDDATLQTYTAATDGLPRKFYLYPSTDSTTKYFFGTILPDFSSSGGVGSTVTLSASWAAASAIIRVQP